MDRERAVSVVPFAPDLLPAVRGFSERYWSRPRSDAYYDWRYLQPQSFSRMFLALQDGDCLGMLFALRKRYRIFGRLTSCLEVFDWHCLPGLRGTGIGIRLMRAMMRQPDPVISVGGTADVLATLPMMGWEVVGNARKYELPLSPELMASRLHRHTGLPEGVSRIAMGRLLAAYFRPHRRRVPATGSVMMAPIPPEVVHPLYGDETGYGLLQEPDPAVLQWVNGSQWNGSYRYLTFTVAGRLRGWAMTRAYVATDGPEGAIVEIFAPRPDVALYTWMVSEAATSLMIDRPRLLHARASCPILQAALLANRFRRKAQDHPVYVWPKGVCDQPALPHVTLNHSDGPLLPYAPGDRAA